MVDYTEGTGKQYHTGIGPEDIGGYVIMPGDPKRCKKIAEHFENPVLVADNREYTTYTGTIDGVKVSVTSTGIGGPSAAIAIEELSKCGAHTFLRVGTCGGMQEDVLGGDIVVASGAIRMEGTSREYAPIEYPAVPHVDVMNAMIRCQASHPKPRLPLIFKLVADRHHLRLMLSKEGILRLYNARMTAELRVRVGAYFLVLANQERAKKGLSNEQAHDTEAAIRTAVEAIRILIQEDAKNE